ncbi:hypothetical protein GGF32_005716 [Allomyces javanicus]|nr:hypothetical protein GGF32_005716 [Allomyces javanicus]
MRRHHRRLRLQLRPVRQAARRTRHCAALQALIAVLNASQRANDLSTAEFAFNTPRARKSALDYIMARGVQFSDVEVPDALASSGKDSKSLFLTATKVFRPLANAHNRRGVGRAEVADTRSALHGQIRVMMAQWIDETIDGTMPDRVKIGWVAGTMAYMAVSNPFVRGERERSFRFNVAGIPVLTTCTAIERPRGPEIRLSHYSRFRKRSTSTRRPADPAASSTRRADGTSRPPSTSSLRSVPTSMVSEAAPLSSAGTTRPDPSELDRREPRRVDFPTDSIGTDDEDDSDVFADDDDDYVEPAPCNWHGDLRDRGRLPFVSSPPPLPSTQARRPADNWTQQRRVCASVQALTVVLRAAFRDNDLIATEWAFDTPAVCSAALDYIMDRVMQYRDQDVRNAVYSHRGAPRAGQLDDAHGHDRVSAAE